MPGVKPSFPVPAKACGMAQGSDWLAARRRDALVHLFDQCSQYTSEPFHRLMGWMCEALGIPCSGFHAWLTRPPSRRATADEEVGDRVRASFLASDRTYGSRRVWRDVLA